jgi:acetyl-CoA C-acetyltransferase
MGMIDDRTPVLVGVAQYVNRDPDPKSAGTPLDTIQGVVEGALDDSGVGPGGLAHIDALYVLPPTRWHPNNVVDLVATHLGIKPGQQWLTASGGEVGVFAANHAARQIAGGEISSALLVNCNAWRTWERAERSGIDLGWPMGGDGEPDWLPPYRPWNSPTETAHRLDMPIACYPVFENSLRAKRGLDLATHRERMGRLMSPFTEVAAANPYAWFPTPRSAEEIITPTPENRMIGFPYTKYLNAVIATDQAASLVMMSAGMARSLGVPADQWVFWWGGHQAAERAYMLSERPDLAACPAMQNSSRTALHNSAVDLERIDIFDFYSCFPVAVEMACEMLGLDETDERGFTVTGGLPYHGGPGSGYTLHSLATTALRLRARPEAIALVTGNGYYLTAHAASVWSGSPKPPSPVGNPPDAGTALVEDPLPVVEIADGPSLVDSYTVLHDRAGEPELGIIIGRLSSGPRFVANVVDRGTLDVLVSEEVIGRPGTVSAGEGVNRFELR